MPKQEDVIVETFNNADIAPLTKKAYINRLMLIDPSYGTSGILFFTKTDDILEKLSNRSVNAKKATIASILSLFKHYDYGKVSKKTKNEVLKAWKIYKNELTNVNNDISSKSNVLSEKDKNNWVSKEDITKKFNSYTRKYRKIIKKKPKELTDDEYKTLLEYVILSLYTLTQPRRERDYFLMFVNNDELNTLDLEKQQFIFREYKDKKALGEQIIDIPDKLFKIIKEYMRITLDRFQIDKDKPIKFLVKPSGYFILRGDIGKYLTDIFGKNVGATSMRRTYVTEKYGKDEDEMKKDALKMGTSSNQIKNHYIKKNAPE